MAKKSSHYSNGLTHGYRSGLEKVVNEQIIRMGHNPRYEARKLPYSKPETQHNYTPDFMLDNGIFIETKGRFTLEDRKKHIWVRDCHPDLDIRFVFNRSKSPTSKGAKGTYADWCNKHGFLYADKKIPEEWFDE